MKTILKIQHQDVTSCYHSCYFFSTADGVMYCNHPYFDDKDSYDCLIINHNNSHNRVPDECPLKNFSVNITNKIKLKSGS